MSFILDALRKVEEERKRASAGEEAPIAIEGGREWGEPRSLLVLTLAAVALLAIVAIGLATYNLIRSRTVTPGPAAPAEAQTPTPVEAPAVVSVPRLSRPPVAPSTHVADTAPSLSAESTPPEVEPEVEPAPPVRLVGRGGDVSPVAVSESQPSTEEPPPADALTPAEPAAPSTDSALAPLPDLILQGTAMVEDRPVAVVNFQRVFEGDIISGARVVKILDRAIELEYLGKRYTLRF